MHIIHARACAVGASMAAVLLAGSAAGQTTVEVNFGQVLTQDDLERGRFDGTAFTLSPETTFELNNGGSMALGRRFAPAFPFDFGGAAVDINRGATLFQRDQIRRENAVFNLFEGGLSASSLFLGEQSLSNIRGGRVAGELDAGAGAAIDMSAGVIDRRLIVRSDGAATVSGGVFGGLLVEEGGELTLSGGEFRLNGQTVDNLDAGFGAAGGLLTGALTDGGVFILSGETGDSVAAGAATINTVDLTPADTTPIVVTSGQRFDTGLRAGQSLTLTGDGRLGSNFAAVSADLNIEGGRVSDGLKTAFSDIAISAGSVGKRVKVFDGSRVEISGGSVGDDFEAFSGAEVAISGGGVGERFTVHDGAQAVVTGGVVGRDLTVRDGGAVTIAGGRVGGYFTADSGAGVTLEGGSVGTNFQALEGSDLTIRGGEFTLNGAPVSGLAAGLNTGDLFTGTLADGSVFIFKRGPTVSDLDRRDVIAPGAATLDFVDLAPIDATPMVVSTGEGPELGLRAGQSLTLTGDGRLRDNFAAVSASLDIDGGVVGAGLETAFSEVNVSGGVVGRSMRAHISDVSISGGVVGHFFDAFDSAVTINGGVVQSAFDAIDSVVNISDGVVQNSFRANNSAVTISGGEVGLHFSARGGEVRITDGEVGHGFRATEAEVSISGGGVADLSAINSAVNISGGVLGRLGAQSGSAVTLSGGGIGELRVRNFSALTLAGGEFMLNGDAISDLSGGLTDGALLTGTLADGSVVIFKSETSPSGVETRDVIARGAATLNFVDLAPIDTTPMIVSTGEGPSGGLRAGQRLTLAGDATLRNQFAAVSATLDVQAGRVGDGLKVAFSDVHVSGGSIGDGFAAFNSRIDIFGGSIGDQFDAFDSDVVISGGDFGHSLNARGGSLTISGGLFNRGGIETNDAEVAISGGEIISASVNGGTLNFSGGVVTNTLRRRAGDTRITGGAIGSLNALNGAAVAIDQGRIGGLDISSNTDFFSPTEATIRGGLIEGAVAVHHGGVLTLEGGSVGAGFQVRDGGLATIAGGEFQLNGQAIDDLSGGLVGSNIFTGTLTDGSVFIFRNESGDRIDAGALTLNQVDLAPADTTPMVVSTGEGPSGGLRPGQTLTLAGDATLRDNFAAVSSTLTVEGGAVGDGLETAFSEISVSGGVIGDHFDAHNSQVSISGGRVGSDFEATGSEVSLTGGGVGRGFRVDDTNALTITGGEFMLDGETISDLSGGLPSGAVLTGTLADGSVFIFNTSMGDRIDAGAATLSQVDLAPADTTPMVVTSGAGPEQGLRAGQRLTLSGTGTLRDHFAAVGATLEVQGGSVGRGLETASSEVTISGGNIDEGFSAFDSRIVVSGGAVGQVFAAFDSRTKMTAGSLGEHSRISGGEATVSGGVVGSGLTIDDGARVAISGGEALGVGAVSDSRLTITGGTVRMSAGSAFSSAFIRNSTLNVRGGETPGAIRLENSAVNIYGGDMSATFHASSGAINLFVTELLIDGVLVDLAEGERMTIHERSGALLEATLSDGAFFDLLLNEGIVSTTQDFVTRFSVVSVTVVPTPGAAALFALAGLAVVRRRR